MKMKFLLFHLTVLALILLFSLIEGKPKPEISKSIRENRKVPERVRERLRRQKSAGDKIITINEGMQVAERFLEGDIKVSDEELDDIRHDRHRGRGETTKRNAVRDRLWIWRTRKIPYVFDQAIIYAGTTEIMNAIAQFNSKTCIQWIARSNETKYVKFVKEVGCWSSVGKQRSVGFQKLSIGDGCNDLATILHEMMHAAGFNHEQSRPDRDQYIEVLWTNIVAGQGYNFKKQTHRQADTLEYAYDYASLMQYGKTGFSKNGLNTMQAKDDPNKQLGQDIGFTDLDLLKLKKFYDCSTPTGGWSSWSSYKPCDSNCVKVRERFCTVESLSSCPGNNIFDGVQAETAICTAGCTPVVNGGWGSWSAWSSCSLSCGAGSQTKTRQCNNPAPSNGGTNCAGAISETQTCNAQSCQTSVVVESCNFDSTNFPYTCGWENDLKNTQSSAGYRYDWFEYSGSTQTAGTGPSGDHTSGTGYYLLLEAVGMSSGAKGRWQKSGLQVTSASCFEFWYNMNGAQMGSLNVYVKTASSETKIWSRTEHQGTSWLKGQVTISSSATYSLVFEGVRAGDTGDIGLDDIQLKTLACTRIHAISKMMTHT